MPVLQAAGEFIRIKGGVGDSDDAAGAIARLQTEYRRLQNRIDAMYLDKLDGRIDTAFFDNKSAEWRAEQDRLLRDVATHQAANQTYIEEGVQLL